MRQDAGKNQEGVGRVKKFWTAQNFLPCPTTGGTRGKDVQHTCNKREAHAIVRVPAVLKTWLDAVRRESLAVCYGQSTVIGRVFRVGIAGNSVCLAACHWQMDITAHTALLKPVKRRQEQLLKTTGLCLISSVSRLLYAL